MEGVTLTQKEQTRLKVLNSVLEDRVSVCQAAEVMGVSERHTRRMLRAYRNDGARALSHGNRGRRPTNSIDKATEGAVVELARTRYAGTNHTHLTELLMEREGIELSRPTVRRILVRAGLRSPRRRRPPKHRERRRRMVQEGMLLQVDGSHHRWLGEEGPRFALLLAVDDATGTVPHALFSWQEDTRSYFHLMEELIQRRGIPLAIYSDRHGVFKFSGDANGKTTWPTHFARAMEELGIRQIFARSPQAKGRVERAAGTFQDRLVTELRLAGAGTIDEANLVLKEFLPRFNERFGVVAEHPGVACRPLESSVILGHILCFKHRRKVAKDNTVKYKNRTLQLLPGKERPSYAGTYVEVLEQSDGQLLLRSRGFIIPSQEAPPRPSLLRAYRSLLPYLPFWERMGNGTVNHQLLEFSSLETAAVDAYSPNGSKRNGKGRDRKSTKSPPRKPTPRQTAIWKAVQEAKRRGLSLRGIARELGIHRNTAKRYAEAESPPANFPKAQARQDLRDRVAVD